MCAALGDYAKTTSPAAFLRQRNSDRPRNDLARLAGARLVTASETPRGQALAEELIKQMTGGDRVAARYLYKEEFQFYPQFKIWLAGNHRPVVSGDEEAIWRRLVPDSR